MGRKNEKAAKTRYAVVGLGWIAQGAVLPAFAHAQNSELVAFVSGDPEKMRTLGKRYGVDKHYSYEQYDDCLQSGDIDAVYIALPNNMHCEYTTRAAAAGIHVLCEKPMAINEDECLQMIEAAEQADVKLMIAYRLHFEEANLKAAELVNSGQLGDARLFNSLFTMQVRDGNIRVQKALGGGPVYDIGIYCINAARALFREEPFEVTAVVVNGGDKRFAEVEEAAMATLRFADDKLAVFTCSFGAADASFYEVVGTRGKLRVEPAFEYQEALHHYLTKHDKTTKTVFSKRDQFAPELIHFSDCIVRDVQPQASGYEGLADIRIIDAIYQSAKTQQPVPIPELARKPPPPRLKLAIKRPAVRGEPALVHVQSPTQS